MKASNRVTKKGLSMLVHLKNNPLTDQLAEWKKRRPKRYRRQWPETNDKTVIVGQQKARECGWQKIAFDIERQATSERACESARKPNKHSKLISTLPASDQVWKMCG